MELVWTRLFEENKEKHKALFELCNVHARKCFDGKFPAKSIKEVWMLNELSRRALSGNLMLISENKTDEEKKTGLGMVVKLPPNHLRLIARIKICPQRYSKGISRVY